MQASVYIQVEHHYNQDRSGISFTRTLKEVPDEFRTYDRLWTIHILHKHEAPGEAPTHSMWCPSFGEYKGNVSTAEKIQNCISTFFAIDSMGIDGAELRHELLQKEPFSIDFQPADSLTTKEAHREFPVGSSEEKKIRKAAEGAIRGAIEMEKILFKNSLGA